MARKVLLLEPIATERDYMAEVLRGAGWSVCMPPGARPAPEDCAAADAIVADLDRAAGEGWVRAADPTPPPARLIVTSRFRAFLAQIRRYEQVAAVVHKPATAEALLEALLPQASDAPTRSRRAQTAAADPLDDPARDAELARRGLRSTTPDPELVVVAELVARGVGTPASVVTVIDSSRQIFLGATGLPRDLTLAGGTLRSWSFCEHVARDNAPLIVEDAREHPALADNPLVAMNMIRAYAGFPVVLEGVGAVGSVCAVSGEPRRFDAGSIATLQLAARLVSEQLARRSGLSPQVTESVDRATSLPATESTAPPEPLARRHAPARLAPGDLVDDKYWITAILGEGGQSQVYLARDKLLGQLVALKVLTEPDDGALLREAEALARLRHPSIVQLYGWGRLDGARMYLILEYVEGETIHRHIVDRAPQGGLMPLPQVLSVVRQIAGALASMHAEGYVHADVKPGNILLDTRIERAVLIDFGLGLRLGRGRPHLVGGTRGYAAPEQLIPEAADPQPALDTYALAAVTYAMLTGRAPFEAASADGIVAMQRRGELTPASSARPGLPPGVDALLARALDPEPSRRLASPVAFADALAAALLAGPGERAPAEVPAPHDGAPQSRGLAFRLCREAAARRLGDGVEARAWGSLDPADRAAIAAATDDTALYPAAPLVAYLRALGGEVPGSVEAVGGALASAALPEMLRRLQVARAPEALLEVAGPLLRRFHAWGRVQLERTSTHSAKVDVWLPEGLAPVMCRYVSGFLRALLATSGRTTRLLELRCGGGGAGACVLQVGWS
ncbi:protein kinase domain-containing protein [Sorangium cellulosum]|uniref:protein kinase domain-containing protein n=1 Tax=Sorangium cellulosum TaxID=56 RepID=UPI000403C2D5|nr:protein kinase [Sorangium cellulosum]